MRKVNGFTLIELLCVLVIISVLIGLSTPRIAHSARVYYFRNKLKQIEALYNYVRREAVLQRSAYKITVDYTARTFQVYILDTANNEENYRRVEDSLVREITLPSNMNMEPGNESPREIIFSPDGRLNSSRIIFSDQGNDRATLSTALSGEITLKFGDES